MAQDAVLQPGRAAGREVFVIGRQHPLAVLGVDFLQRAAGQFLLDLDGR